MTTFSFVVLATAAVALAALVWFTIAADSWVGYALAAIGWLVALASLGDRPRLPSDVRVLHEDEHPSVFRLVRELAQTIDVAPPDVVGVDTDLNAYVSPLGWRRRNALVIGLSLWTLETDEERLATLAHELGHLRGRDTARGRIIGSARALLLRWYSMVHPGHFYYVGNLSAYDPSPDLGLLGRTAQQVQVVLAWPLGLLVLLFDRLHANSRQHQEYLADRRAALVAGSAAMASGLRLDHLGLDTALRSAVFRGEDPFDYLAGRQADAGLRRSAVVRGSAHRSDASHPPDDLRVSLLDALAAPPAASAEVRAALTGADRELTALRPALVRQLKDELRSVAW